MKGAGNEHVDCGTLYDRILRAVEGWARRKADKRYAARVEAARYSDGTRIVTNGKCCLHVVGMPPKQGTILKYIEEADDYWVALDNDPDALSGYRYLCANGMEPTGGRQSKEWLEMWEKQRKERRARSFTRGGRK